MNWPRWVSGSSVHEAAGTAWTQGTRGAWVCARGPSLSARDGGGGRAPALVLLVLRLGRLFLALSAGQPPPPGTLSIHCRHVLWGPAR